MANEYPDVLRQAREDIATDEEIWAYDVQNNRIYWSPPLFEMLGRAREEAPLTLEAVLALVHPEERSSFKQVIQNSINTADPFEAKFDIRHISGHYIPVHVVGKVYLDNERKPVRISGRMKPITDRWVAERTATLEKLTLSQNREIAEQKEIEVELKKSLKREKLIKHVIQLMNRSFDTDIILEIVVREIGIFLGADRCMVVLHDGKEGEGVTQKRRFIQYYRSGGAEPILEEQIPRELADFSDKESVEGPPLRLITPPDIENTSPIIQEYLERQSIQSYFSIEVKYRGTSFGRLVLHQCSYPRVWTESEKVFLEILAAHIGAALYQVKLYQEEKQAKQEAEEANRQKSKILSFVSHDFKNPLASIERFIEIMKNDKNDVLSEKHREVIGYISDGVHQLRNMVINILDKARLAEGKIMPLPEWIALKPFINELKPLFNSMAFEREIELNIEIQSGLTEIKADPTHLRQILTNLISNACKYNRIAGKVFLRFHYSHDGQAVMIEVQDSGFGIAPEKMSQIFIEYFRTDLSKSTSVEGSGLGLAFTKKLIDLQGGNITVELEMASKKVPVAAVKKGPVLRSAMAGS